MKKIPKLKTLSTLSPKTKNILKYVFGGALVLLAGAVGLEATNNDWDLGKLLKGESLKEAKVKRDKSGNVVTEGGKYTDEYNCEDFATQEEAQTFYKNAGGLSKDTNRLDGDKDSIACEHLPKQKE
ncbi:MAG: excalibur calcium-binding domain-containing protein [Candidatus Dojkabacteria bacterium]|jgi:hypothetical protein